MSNRIRQSLAATSICISTLLSAAQAAEMPASLQVAQANLVLNGSGVRTKGPFQLYLAGLYLLEKNNEPGGIIAANDPMAIRIEIVSRLVSQSRMIDSLNEGFEKSTGGNLSAIEDEISRFRKLFDEKISRGDVFEIVYVPEMGTMVSQNGKKKGVVEGVDFKKALFGIWLSKQPCDADLKRGLLAAERRSTSSLVEATTR